MVRLGSALFLLACVGLVLWGGARERESSAQDPVEVRPWELASNQDFTSSDNTPSSDLPLYLPKETVYLRVNLPATRLDFFVGDKLFKSYPIAIGMSAYPTPVREFSIEQIIWNPWWIPPDSDWARNASPTPPGPGNPLGPVKMLMESGVRIHGTNKPESIGHAASHACLRMHSEDAAELAWEIQQRYSEKSDPQFYEQYRKHRGTSYYVSLMVPVSVSVEYQLVELQGKRLLLHPDLYGRGGFQAQVVEALRGFPEIIVDDSLIAKLNKLRREETVEVSLTQLADWSRQVPPTQLGQALPSTQTL